MCTLQDLILKVNDEPNDQTAPEMAVAWVPTHGYVGGYLILANNVGMLLAPSSTTPPYYLDSLSHLHTSHDSK